ncbi:hypothetical protein Btru_032009 [Bulinus truncatus]|nr:hypothetical protein Btru_032009 [Bulinus truncatus]
MLSLDDADWQMAVQADSEIGVGVWGLGGRIEEALMPVLDASNLTELREAIKLTISRCVLNTATFTVQLHTSSSMLSPDTSPFISSPDTSPSIPGPNTISSIPCPDTGSSSHSPDTSSSIPGPDTSSSIPGPDTSSSIPGPDTSSSIPGPDTSSSIPGLDTSSSIHVPDTSSSIHVPDTSSSIPGPDTNSSISGPDTSSSIPGPDTSSSIPVPDTSSSIPVPDTSSSIPVPDTSSSIHVPDTSSSIPSPDTSSSIPGPDTSSSIPGPDTSSGHLLWCTEMCFLLRPGRFLDPGVLGTGRAVMGAFQAGAQTFMGDRLLVKVFLRDPLTSHLVDEHCRPLPNSRFISDILHQKGKTVVSVNHNQDSIRDLLGSQHSTDNNHSGEQPTLALAVLLLPIPERGTQKNIGLVVVVSQAGSLSSVDPKRIELCLKQISITYEVVKTSLVKDNGPPHISNLLSLIHLCGELNDPDAAKLEIKVVRYLQRQTDAESGFLLLVVPETQMLFCQAVGDTVLEEEIRFAGPSSCFAKALESKQPLTLADIPVHQKTGDLLCGWFKFSDLLCGFKLSNLLCEFKFSDLLCGFMFSDLLCGFKFSDLLCGFKFSDLLCGFKFSDLLCGFKFSDLLCRFKFGAPLLSGIVFVDLSHVSMSDLPLRFDESVMHDFDVSFGISPTTLLRILKSFSPPRQAEFVITPLIRCGPRP